MIATARIQQRDDCRQTIELPCGFELAAEEVWVHKDDATGQITLTPRSVASDPPGLDRLFALLDAAPLPAEFLSDRQDPRELPTDPLADWTP